MNLFIRRIAALALSFIAINPIAAQWANVGTAGITGAVANYTCMAVDNTNTPYIAYKDNANGDKVSVLKWNGSSWASIGTGISGGSVDYVAITIDQATNDVYVGYEDNNASSKLTVKLYSNGSWSTVGSTGNTSGSVSYVSLAVYDGVVLAAYRDGANSNKLSCRYYYNGAWYSLGNAGFTSGSVTQVNTLVTRGGLGYVAYRDHNNKPAAYEWTNNGWVSLGNVSSNTCSDLSVTADVNGDPYVCFIDGGNSNKLTVRKYTSSWSTVGSAGFTPSSAGTPDIEMDLNNNTPYVLYRDDNNNQEASVMKYNGSSWANLGTAGFSANTVDYTSLIIDDNGILYAGYKDNSVSQKATVMKYTTGSGSSATLTWNGSNSTDWANIANWTPNIVPTSTNDVIIPGSLSSYPDLTSATTYYCFDITIQSGATVNVNNSSAKLRVNGNIDNDGTLTVPNGRIEMMGSTAQTISSVHTLEVDELRLSNSAGCTLLDSVRIVDYYLPSSGTLTTNSKLILKSTSSKTGRIDIGSTSGNYISGNVWVQRYIPGGRRAFRFLSHPFSSAIPLSQLIDDIDITGSGGSANGFTTVSVNSPSAFYFDVTTADTSTAGNNPGWKDYKSANTNLWDPYEMARILVRGSKGQGLTSGSYTPNAVTLDLLGPVNQGNKSVVLAKGTNSKFVMCGNPYPSTVNLKNVARTSNVSTNFTIWNPSQGTKGGYTSYQFSSDYYLPIGGAFVTEVNSGTSATFTFEEGDKSTGTPASLFKGTADPLSFGDSNYVVELSIEDSTTTTFWDRLLIQFDDTTSADRNDMDMKKLNNPDLEFYTYMPDTFTHLSVDVRPYEPKKVIPLGLDLYQDDTLVIRVPKMRIPPYTVLIFNDLVLGKSDTIKEGFEYWFIANVADSLTLRTSRFSINMDTLPQPVVAVNNIQKTGDIGKLLLSPNPATNLLHVEYDVLKHDAVLRMADVTGHKILEIPLTEGSSSMILNLQNLPNGMYIAEVVEANNKRAVGKFIKQ